MSGGKDIMRTTETEKQTPAQIFAQWRPQHRDDVTKRALMLERDRRTMETRRLHERADYVRVRGLELYDEWLRKMRASCDERAGEEFDSRKPPVAFEAFAKTREPLDPARIDPAAHQRQEIAILAHALTEEIKAHPNHEFHTPVTLKKED